MKNLFQNEVIVKHSLGYRLLRFFNKPQNPQTRTHKPSKASQSDRPGKGVTNKHTKSLIHFHLTELIYQMFLSSLPLAAEKIR